LVLAPSQFKWFFEQPDTIISLDAASNESLYAKYNFLGDANPKDHFNNTIVHRNLAKALSGLVPGMQEDIQHTIDLKLGLDKENWKTINTWGMWLTTIPRVSNVMILGKELGRNPKVVGAFVQFVQLVHHNIGTLNKFFSTLHPLIGRWLARRNQECFDRATAYTMPVIQQRLLDMEKKATDDSFKWQEPEDAITWCIRQARAENNIKELQAKSIAKRLLLVELGSVFTTAITAQNTLIDIISSSSTDVDTLREEAVRVFSEENQTWTQAGVTKLLRLDSAIRESQRHSNFAVTMLDHKVVAPGGVTNESEGWHVPYGALLNVNLNGVYHDPELHSDPERYDPLRFSRSIEAGTVDEKNRYGIVSTSEEHLVFGHGKRAW
jgi:cytochrome P450